MAEPLQVLAAVAPSVGVGAIFWFAMRAVINADRRERAAIAALEAEHVEGGNRTDS